MNNSSKKKSEQLGINAGTAAHRLRKQILFKYVVKAEDNYCFRCGEEIIDYEDLSIDHKEPWLDENVDLFWDLDNIAFSHKSCNYRAGRRNKGIQHHGGFSAYQNHGCRCKFCKDYQSKKMKKYNERRKNTPQ